jgi:hypothetical protein
MVDLDCNEKNELKWIDEHRIIKLLGLSFCDFGFLCKNWFQAISREENQIV